jgi:hypothetical protein
MWQGAGTAILKGAWTRRGRRPRGQNVLEAAADKRTEATYNDADAVLHEAVKSQEHLAAQDTVLDALVSKLQAKAG